MSCGEELPPMKGLITTMVSIKNGISTELGILIMPALRFGSSKVTWNVPTAEKVCWVT